MFNLQRLLAVVVTAAHILTVLSFQPGSDYDEYKTTNLYNCTGRSSASNVTVRNAFDTLPQIEPLLERIDGWEHWSLFLHGTFPMILRWGQGAQSAHVLASAYFHVIVGNLNGTTIQAKVIGNLSYTNGERTKRISIGDNTLTWDSAALWYNVSVNIDGYMLNLDSFSATLDTFHPNVALHNGLLDQDAGFFGSVPVPRGHVVGSLSTPTGNFTLEGLTVLRHMFSKNALPNYIDKFGAGTFWGYSEKFYDTHLFFQMHTTNDTVHEAAFLGRAAPSIENGNDFSSAWATYAVTDDKLYSLSASNVTNTINASFSGCANDSEIPYVFNATKLTLLGEIQDNAGGSTTYYTVNGTTSAPFNGVVSHGSIAGIFEEYKAPPVPSSGSA